MKTIYNTGIENLNKLLLMHILAASIIISTFVIQFSKPRAVIALHIGMVASLYFLAFYLSRFCKSHFRRVSIFVFSTLTGFLALIYIMSFLTNKLWNNNLSLESISLSIVDLPTILEDVSHGITIIIIFVASLFVGIFWLYNKYCHYLRSYDATLEHKDLRIHLAFTISMLALISLSFKPTYPGIWSGEPISSLAIKTTPTPNVNITGGEITFENGASVKNRKLQNIILIHADAMRADHMSSYGYERDTTPYIKSLVKNKNTSQINTGLSICSESICGMLSALTSRHIDSINTETPTIITHLKTAGYRTLVAGSGDFSIENVSHYLSRDTDHFERADLDENYTIYDDMIILSSLSKISNYEDIPTFFFLRYMSSHRIGRHFPQFAKYTPFKKSLLSIMFPAFDDLSTTINGYDNGIIQLDNAVRLSIKLLSEKGYMDNSVLIIYGDHGEAINEHGYFGHVQNLYQEEIHVPIIFMNSRHQVIKDNEFATLNDILPTVLDIINTPIPNDIEGVSLLNRHNQRYTYHDNRRGIYGIVEKNETNIYKLIYDSNKEDEYFYDLTNDPSEKNNIGLTEHEKVKKLLEKLKSNFDLS